MKVITAGGIVWALTGPALAGNLHADIECRPVGAEPVFDCTVRLTDTGTQLPVSNAKFTVGADMPSMPMVHNIRPTAAIPSAEPGLYRTRLQLGMYGTWNVKLRISTPGQDQINKTMELLDLR